MKLYGTINNIDGGARNDYTCYMCELMHRKQSNSAVVERICWPWVNTVSTSTWPGWKYKRSMRFIRVQAEQQATASVKVRTLDAFYREHIIVCK